MDIKIVGVLGAGQMGGGIAQVAAAAGYEVLLADASIELAQKGRGKIDAILGKQVEKGKMKAEEKDALVGRIKPVAGPADFGPCDLVIEAATENLELKLKILRQVDALAKPSALIASNTSSISITTLAAVTSRPASFLGVHFFNPVPMMALVELVRGLQTSDATIAAATAFAKRLGKTPIVVKNSPGFVVNRLLCPMLNEAVFALQEGLASAQAIDEGMKLGCNHPIGPLALADLIGLDVMLAVMNVFYADFNDPKYRPAPLLREMVAAGWLGRKSGRGFYDYTQAK